MWRAEMLLVRLYRGKTRSGKLYGENMKGSTKYSKRQEEEIEQDEGSEIDNSTKEKLQIWNQSL